MEKPLLSRIRFEGKLWSIQYEGIFQLCNNCGKIGHVLEKCPLLCQEKEEVDQESPQEEEMVLETLTEKYEPWMKPVKPVRLSQQGTTNNHGKETQLEPDNSGNKGVRKSAPSNKVLTKSDSRKTTTRSRFVALTMDEVEDDQSLNTNWRDQPQSESETGWRGI